MIEKLSKYNNIFTNFEYFDFFDEIKAIHLGESECALSLKEINEAQFLHVISLIFKNY